LGLKFDAKSEKSVRLGATGNYLVGFLVLLTILFYQELNQVLASIATVGATSLAIYSRSFSMLRTRKVASFLFWVGERSYSIYLIHYPLIFIAKQSPFFDLGIHGGRQIPVLIAVVLTLSASDYMFRNVEVRYKYTMGKPSDSN